MKPLNHFLIEPIGARYNNVKKVGDKELIVNSENQNHQYINRLAKVISCPFDNKTSITEGDTVLVHHNVFRRWSDVKGRDKNSSAYFKENLYLVYEDQIFLYRKVNNSSRFKSGPWQACDGFCFVQPLINDDKFDSEKEHPHKGVIVYTDGTFDKKDVVGYTPFSQYEFIIEGKRLFRVHNKFITIKYEHEGNEETYNPSWAKSS